MRKSAKTEKEQNPAVLQSADEQTAANAEILSRKRRMALVSYLAILFATAFLLVAISMVIENRQLQDSKGTLNSRISQLQEDNEALLAEKETLQKNNKDLTEEHSSLKQELEGIKQENTAAAEQIEQLKSDKERLENERNILSGQIETSALKAQSVIQVHELLLQAVAADEEGDYERLQSLLEQIEPMKDLLCPSALEIYMELALA